MTEIRSGVKLSPRVWGVSPNVSALSSLIMSCPHECGGEAELEEIHGGIIILFPQVCGSLLDREESLAARNEIQ